MMKLGIANTVALALCVAGICTFAPGAAAARNCTAEEKASGDRQLRLNTRDKQAAAARHAPWGLPVAEGAADREVMLTQRDYLLNYDGDLRSPLWVAYKLDSRRIGREDRIDCFRTDIRLRADAASAPADFDEPIFDQGHVAPNGDMSSSTNSVVNSFIQSNMAPQYCHFNRGVWQILESLVRHWVDERRILFVMSGAVFDRDGDGARDADAEALHMRSNNGNARVGIASAFYKIIVWEGDDGRLHSIGFMMPHDQTDLDGDPALAYLEDHIVKLAEIESAASLDILPAVENPLEEAEALWPHEGFVAHTLVNAVCRRTTGMEP
jgi:endonuclease G, mitochondrial